MKKIVIYNGDYYYIKICDIYIGIIWDYWEDMLIILWEVLKFFYWFVFFVSFWVRLEIVFKL